MGQHAAVVAKALKHDLNGSGFKGLDGPRAAKEAVQIPIYKRILSENLGIYAFSEFRSMDLCVLVVTRPRHAQWRSQRI